MAYELHVDHPDFPKGFEFDCDGILVKNGESKKLSKEDELAFIGRWGRDVKHFYGHGEVAKVTGSSELSSKEKQDAMPEPATNVGVELVDGEIVKVEQPENGGEA